MFTILTNLGLVATAFAMYPGLDIRGMKIYVALAFAVALGLLECTKGFKKIRNKGLLLFLFYLMISQFMAPGATINISGVDLIKFWSWEPLCKILLMFFLFMAVQSHSFSEKELSTIISTMIWCGTAMSVYIFFQALHIDQLFVPTRDDNAHLAGFVGNPTHVSPYIAMITPLALFRRKYAQVIVMIVAIAITKSAFAYVGLVFALCAYYSFMSRRIMVLSIIMISLWFIVALNFSSHRKDLYIQHPLLREALTFTDNSRFLHWKTIAKDIVSPIGEKVAEKYPLTGRGVGSFKIVYHQQHNNNYKQAHNEYLEIAYTSGIVGILLFLYALWNMFRNQFGSFFCRMYGVTQYRAALMASIVCMLVVSCGTFILQIGTTAFYSVVMCGLLENTSEIA